MRQPAYHRIPNGACCGRAKSFSRTAARWSQWAALGCLIGLAAGRSSPRRRQPIAPGSHPQSVG